ncbi:MAG: alpha-2-macroglobulin family protein [Planctomycetaceae bacterium]
MTWGAARADDVETGPRAAAWRAVQRAFDEGKPKTALESLAGVEAAATRDEAWAEVARAIASRILAETGDRPPDDPERVVRLAAAIDRAPPETRGVLEAIRANWTWGYFQMNRWRYQQRTQGGVDGQDLARLAEWDLPTIVAEIRARFAAALGAPGSPGRTALQKLAVADWSTLIEKGEMPDAWRPTVWDVIVHDALEFAASGERGLVAPEDAFELDAESPALGTLEEFLAWRPEADAAVTDTGSPLIEAAGLYRALLEFHRGDADRSALLSGDLDRILWAGGAAVGPDLTDGKQAAFEAFVARAGDHETAALARFHLAQLVREKGDLVEARAIALVAAEQHPKSAGGAKCRNLVAEIEGRDLALVTERSWAEPWPVVRVNYRNLTKVFLRLAKADLDGRLRAGKPHAGWLDDARAAILALPAVTTHAADLPATPDYQSAHHDIPVAAAFDAGQLEPGAYWLIASHRDTFAEGDNVVGVTMVHVTRLAIVTDQAHQVFAGRMGGAAAAAGPGDRRRPRPGQGEAAPLAGHVVDIASGEPVKGAAVQAYVRGRQGNPPPFVVGPQATTDADGRFDLACEQGRELVVVATATLDGKQHRADTDPTNVWRNVVPERTATVVLVTDRGIHRPGQVVFYKGIVCAGDQVKGEYAAVAGRAVEVTFRDANGREVAKANHKTNANGSFHGNFPIATGALPGQWSIQANAGEAQSGVGVRVEEYKRPKFLVTLAAPEKSAPLGGDVVLTGTATTYTGLPVADATVKWRVERQVRWPIWCRCSFPSLPFGGEAQRIARGTAKTDANGTFTVTFPAKPDRSVPRESLPVFTFRVTADVTDAGGETRTGERGVSAGYTDLEAALATKAWQAARRGEPAAVEISLATTTLDGAPRAAAGTLTVSRLVQPAEVARGELFDAQPFPVPRPRRVRPVRGGRGRAGAAIPRPKPEPVEPNPADPETWAAGEAVFTEQVATDAATGKAAAKPNLPPGIYRAVFEIPARGDVPAVKAQQVVEVIDPDAQAYGVKRALAMFPEQESVEPGAEFRAVVGTGYAKGRALVEISQAGEVLERTWTDAGRTQWPVSLKVTKARRGGFTVRVWLVRDGRLRVESRTIDVPWTNKRLALEWQRFTRRVEPGAKEVWRATITGVDPATPAAAEFLALAYDQSLDALAPHQWSGDGLAGLFRREATWTHVSFTNGAAGLNHVLGTFDMAYADVPAKTFRRLRDPFGSPAGGGWGFARGGMVAMDAAPLAMEMTEFSAAPMAAAGRAMPKRAANAMRATGDDRQAAQGAEPPPAAPAAAAAAPPPPPRKNLVETAFFLPVLASGSDGIVTIEFTLPDTLTTWQFKGLAHDAALRSGVLLDTAVAAKDLMVEPLVPRFLREGDVVRIPVKVSNKSDGRLAGKVTFTLADARTNDSRDGLIDGPKELPFDLAAGESKPVVFTVKVADGTDALRYLAVGTATGSAKPASDGEEALLPVLPSLVLVTETVPITIRGPGERKVSLERLATSAGTDIRSQSLVVQAASNPAWYAVLALPSIMEEADESTETLFTRLYANSLARHLATRDPRIAKVFEQWKGTTALESPLEKNTDLMKTLLAETPWVRDAVDEKEARARIALLFDATRAANEMQAALARLAALRNNDGGWPWFPGGQTCDSVTLGIIAGFGRLRAAGVDVDVQPAIQALPWLDGRLLQERRWAEKIEEPVLTPIGAYALYARSFFTPDAPPQGEAAAAIQWGLDVGRRRWMKIDDRRSQGHLAITLARAGDKETALSIVDSLRQRAVDADVKPGQEKESWQGMWWRDPHPGWWSWAHAPIATQAIMVECFDEVAGDTDAVEALKAWLLAQKRTSAWRGSRATADAVGALLGRGGDLLASQALVTVTVGGETIESGTVEAGTGFFETRFVRREIEPGMAAVTMKKPDAGLAWGGVHWQYLDDIAKVPAAGREELAIEKQLFVKRFTKAGPELVPAKEGAATTVAIGDELVVRLVVTSDRDYEFLELADHRPSLTEPVDVLSGWRFGDGAAWYVAIRDTSTQMFFERLPRGTHVFEYSLRTAHRGTASSGFATIRSRYAPEFSAHSASVAVEVE